MGELEVAGSFRRRVSIARSSAAHCNHAFVEFVRFESPTANRRGAHIGIFGLANGLGKADLLSVQDRAWLAKNNAWGDAAYTDPATVDPTIFDKVLHPLATCWFKVTAVHLLSQVRGYLDLLDRYGVSWREVRSFDPGRPIYEDDVQLVVVPYLQKGPYPLLMTLTEIPQFCSPEFPSS